MPQKSKQSPKDPEREEFIDNEILVEAHGSDERAMSWYYHLDNNLQPFTACCTQQRAISVLEVGDEVEVLGVAPVEECSHELFVMIRWSRRGGLGVPLSQLEVVDAEDEETEKVVKDWLYWVAQGYQF